MPALLTKAARRSALPLGGLVVVYLVSTFTSLGRLIDISASLGRFQAGQHARRFDQLLLGSMSSAGALAVVAVVILIAALRGRQQRGLRVAVAVIGAVLSAELLKLVLPSYNYVFNNGWQWGGSYPSGHTTAAAGLSLAVLSVCSERWRRVLIGPCVAGVILTATATVTLGWHRPSDVVGGLLLALAWHRALTAPEHSRRVPGVVLGLGGLFALGTATGVIGVAVHGALSALSSPPWLPPWMLKYIPIDWAHAVAYVAGESVLCLAAGLALLTAAFPYVPTPPRDRAPGHQQEQRERLGSTLAR